MRASLTVLAAVLLVVAALVVSGCGLKGDLYLPEDQAPASSDESADSADDANEEASG